MGTAQGGGHPEVKISRTQKEQQRYRLKGDRKLPHPGLERCQAQGEMQEDKGTHQT